MEITNDKYIIRKHNKFFVHAIEKDTNIAVKKIFNITFRYAKGHYYKGFLSFLNYVGAAGIEIDNKITEDFKKKSAKIYVNPDVYLKDLELFRNIVNNINPSDLPKATGSLREKQVRELNFAKELIADIEKNTNLKPFMDDGTLLGAVRHKGFIPWDDDVDFSLMRNDYEKLEEYFKQRYRWIDTNEWGNKHFNKRVRELLAQNPDEIICLERPTSMKCFKLIDGNVTFCDFFALDYYSDEFDLNSFTKYIKDIKEKQISLKTFGEVFDFYRKEIGKNTEIVSESNTVYAGIDNYDFYHYKPRKLRRKDDIFPLKKMQFEDTEFWAPNNEVNCLDSIYDNYQKLPILILLESHKIKKV